MDKQIQDKKLKVSTNVNICNAHTKKTTFRTDSYNILRTSLRISGIHTDTQIIVVTMEMYLVGVIKNIDMNRKNNYYQLLLL